MKETRSMTGHQLQFLKPWEYLTKPHDIPYERLGIIAGENSKQEIDKQASIANKIMQDHSNIFTLVKKEEQIIHKILTPQGLRSFLLLLEGKEEGNSFLMKLYSLMKKFWVFS